MIRIDVFKGASMRIAPHLIPQDMAQYAKNIRVDDGRLRGWNALGPSEATLAKSPVIKSLYRWADVAWFHWRSDVDAVHGPIPDDTEERTYYTGDAYPKMTYAGIATDGGGNYPSASYRLGIPAPADAPVATVSGNADNDDDIPESRAYVVTYVSAKGEEGPPSPASNIVSVKSGQSVDLSGLSSAPTGNYNINRKRIYRTATDATNTNFLYVDEIAVAFSTYSDVLDGASLGEELPSLTWIAPPDDMKGLIGLPNGSMAAFRGRELMLCEPYVPHAWPLDYRYTVDDPIVAIGAIGSLILVLTQGKPYVAQATHPASLSLDKAESPYPCVSKRGAVDMGSAILYPGPDGLMAFSGKAPVNITKNLIDPDAWAALKPSSMHAYRYKNRYVAFYDTEVKAGGLMIDESAEQLTYLDAYADAGWVDPDTSDLYLVTGKDIRRFDYGAPLQYTWRSKRYVTPHPLNAGFLKVRADAYPVHLKVITGKYDVRWEGDVDDNHARPMPDGRASSYTVEISGANAVRSVGLAETIQELDNV